MHNENININDQVSSMQCVSKWTSAVAQQSDFTFTDWVRAEKGRCSHSFKRTARFDHLSPLCLLATYQVTAIFTGVVSIRVVMQEGPKEEELGLKHQRFGPRSPLR
jgi:hypothetical protein